MHSTAIIVCSVLFGQLPGTLAPISEPEPSISEAPPAALQPVAPRELNTGVPDKKESDVLPAATGRFDQAFDFGVVLEEGAKRALTPPKIVAGAIVLPAGHRLTGRPSGLSAAVSSTTDRRRQIEVVQAYWRLVEAVGDYRFCLDYDRRLKNLSAHHASAWTGRRAALTSSTAQLREAEAAVVAAQHDLASLAMFPPEAPLPLPVDPPHAGPYTTHFDELFSRRTAPSTLRLIDRTLPIRWRAIEDRALAILTAEDALEAALAAYPKGGVDLPTVLTCLRQCLRQRRAMIRTVCLYNRDIADYAMAIAGPKATGQELVQMLIETTQGPVRPLVPKSMPVQPGGPADSGVERAGFHERAPAPATPLERSVPTPAQPQKGVPTPAVRPGAAGASGGTTPKPDGGWMPSPPSPNDLPMAPMPLPLLPPAMETPKAENPFDKGTAKETPEAASIPANKGSPKSEVVPIKPAPLEPVPLAPVPREVKKPVVEKEPANVQATLEQPQAVSTAPAMYPALVDAAPGTRTKQLTLALHWDRSLPEGTGTPISLEECLKIASAHNRGAVIGAYWRARQRAAEYQAVLAQAESVDDLIQSIRPGDNFGLRRLRSAQATTRAARDEAHAALVEAQFDLADLLGRSSDELWPIPNTAPHSGPYRLKLEAQPRKLTESWSFRRLAAMIPATGESVQQHATAVVEADAARADAAAKLAENPRSIEQVLANISRQTESTFRFLQSLTDYNLAIADYALTVLPPETPSENLAGALVVGK